MLQGEFEIVGLLGRQSGIAAPGLVQVAQRGEADLPGVGAAQASVVGKRVARTHEVRPLVHVAGIIPALLVPAGAGDASETA